MIKTKVRRWAAGAGLGLLLMVPLASADAAVLATVRANVTGDAKQETVELTGEKLIPGSNYYGRLTLLVKNEQGRMLTVWKPDVDGGYYCLLEKITAAREGDPVPAGAGSERKKQTKEENDPFSRLGKKDKTADSPAAIPEREIQAETVQVLKKLLKEMKGEQEEVPTAEWQRSHDGILLMVGKGGLHSAVDSRILNFSDVKHVREDFSGADSLGLSATARYLPGYRFAVQCMLPSSDQHAKQELEFTGKAASVFGLYGENGSLAKTHLKPVITEVVSLTWQSDRLFTLQNVLAADRRSVLGQLAARWEKDKNKWRPVDVKLLDGSERTEDAADQPAGAGTWKLYPRMAWIGERVISRPTVAVEEQPEIQNKINDTLDASFRSAPAEEERAYQVKFAGPGLLSLELGRRNQQGAVIRELLNFDMKTGKTVGLQEMFRTEDADFLKVLNLIGDKKDAFKETKPAFWHYDGIHFIFQDRLLTADFQDEEKIHLTVVDQNDMAKFLKRPELLEP